ncbi:YybH family protein [Phytoactinopolyspora mesophila]|uniref:SgcJ/EcaC family oxidoreductase n=1 Tax=Phytoactinopolyspora mesophila TaxID=2650750 RepID=A0A7K3M980_9ACTN|nr:nuclear transport factor 2 family protein [Phytoactinopolyspora mesophila]NDL59839.1 SgcJ/EcaC family oxidoreductase [Phytoactinopolyspora mesophila]
MNKAVDEVTSFMREYEAASNRRDLDHLASLITDDATYWFSDGSHQGITAILEAIRATFDVIRDETYEIRDLELVTVTQEAAVCRYHFAWTGTVDGEPQAGSGRGTNVVVKRDGDWRMLHEHLSA